MLELRELYQEIILDHNRNPRNHHEMEAPSQSARGFNPLCGDKLTLYLKIEQGRIADISFMGSGCAISQASASLMTEAMQGKTLAEAKELFTQFHNLLTLDEPCPSHLDKLTVLAGVRSFPARVKCATLAWHTLDSALKQEAAVVCTE